MSLNQSPNRSAVSVTGTAGQFCLPPSVSLSSFKDWSVTEKKWKSGCGDGSTVERSWRVSRSRLCRVVFTRVRTDCAFVWADWVCFWGTAKLCTNSLLLSPSVWIHSHVQHVWLFDHGSGSEIHASLWCGHGDDCFAKQLAHVQTHPQERARTNANPRVLDQRTYPREGKLSTLSTWSTWMPCQIL